MACFFSLLLVAAMLRRLRARMIVSVTRRLAWMVAVQIFFVTTTTLALVESSVATEIEKFVKLISLVRRVRSVNQALVKIQIVEKIESVKKAFFAKKVGAQNV